MRAGIFQVKYVLDKYFILTGVGAIFEDKEMDLHF